MPLTCLGIAHVSLLVSDVDLALEFYHRVLGLPISQARPDLGYPGAWLDLPGGQQIHLIGLKNRETPAPSPRPGVDRHLALVVDAVDPVRQALNQAGVVCVASRSGRPAVFCRDPDGNALEFIAQASSDVLPDTGAAG